MPKVTIAMPVFNDEKYVYDAVRSILDQTYTDFTLLVIDDGSTDGTRSIIEAFDDKRITIISHEANVGRPNARNTALDAADSQYLAWMDADDISLPQRIQRQVDFMDRHPTLSASSATLRFFYKKKGTSKGPGSLAAIRAFCVFGTPVTNAVSIMRLDDIRRTSIRFDPKQKRAEDFAFWADVILGKGMHVCNMNDVLYHYRYEPRPHNDSYHALAVRNHIFPILGIEGNEHDSALHTALVCSTPREIVEKFGLAQSLQWLETIWQATNMHSALKTTEMAVLLRNMAERVMAVGDMAEGMRIWERLSLGKLWSPLLVKSRILLRKFKNSVFEVR